MPRSSRHKSHKHSKHSSRDYSDSEEDVVIKMKEKSSKDDGSTRSHRDSASGEKRKISSRESKDSKGPSGHGNGDVLEEYVPSKRRKGKIDAVVGGDRWNGGGDVEKESHKGEILKIDAKSKETIGKAESVRVESKSKSKRHDTGTCGERKEDNLVSAVAEKEESKIKGESKRKSGRESSSRKEGKESKEKDRRLEKDKNGGQESKVVDAEVKLVDVDVGKKQAAQLVDLSGEKQCKRSRENNEHTSMDELRNLELEKDVDKKIRRKKEGSSEREKYYDELKESDGRRLSSKGDRAKDSKHRDDRHKDGVYAEKYQEDGHEDDRRKDDKYREEAADKDNKHHNDEYREDGESDARRRDDKHREDGDRDSRRKDEKLRDDGERDSRRKDDKYHDIEKEGQRDDKYHEDGDRDRRRKDDRNHEDGGKDIRREDERYYEDGDRDDRRKDSSYRDGGDRDDRRKDRSYRDGGDRDYRYKEEKYREDIDREKRPRDTKYRDERASKDRSGDKSDPKRSRDDGFVADHHVRKSSAYDDSPTRDDRTARYRDDQGTRRTNDKEEYGDIKSRGSKDQITDFDKNGGSSARMDPVTDRVRPSSRNVEVELTSSYSRRRSSPTSSSHAPRDNYRSAKQDESKYRDYNYEDRSRHNMNSTRDYNGPVGGSDKTSSSRSLDKLGQKDNSNCGDFSAERHIKPDTRSSPLKLVDKSPSTSADRRQFNRPDVRRNIDVDDSTQRSGGSRDWKDYSSKDVHPAEELVQADPDTQSISSPFTRNNHFSNNFKSFPPPPPQFRTTGDSPLTLGSGEDDGRGKPNMRSSHRRMNEPNMGRMQGNNTWRGIPSWPSPIPNGFLPFPHAPPFHSVMQPFPAPPMFGVRSSMELNHHPSPYHMSDPDRYSGPGRPMGWRNQVDDSQLHGWDTSSAVFGDESHIYGRSDWDHSRNMLGNRGWERSVDLWKGPNRTASVEMIPEKENNNNSMLSGDEIQPPQNEQTRVDQQADSGDVVQPMNNFEKNEIWDPVGSEDGGIAKVSRKNDVPVCNVYLSKLDISAELAEPELFNKCACLFDADKIISPFIDDSKILYMEDVEAKMALVSNGLLSITLFASTNDSVFQKSMSLYKRHKESFSAEYGGKPKVSSNVIPNPNQEDQNVDVKTENHCPTDSIMQGLEDIKTETLQENIDPPTGYIITENPKETVSTLVDLQMHDAEFKALPEENVEGPAAAAPLGHVDVFRTGPAIKIEELESVDTKYGPLLNFHVSPEASEAMMPESVNLSRIHHSPESTH